MSHLPPRMLANVWRLSPKGHFPWSGGTFPWSGGSSRHSPWRKCPPCRWCSFTPAASQGLSSPPSPPPPPPNDWRSSSALPRAFCRDQSQRLFPFLFGTEMSTFCGLMSLWAMSRLWMWARSCMVCLNIYLTTFWCSSLSLISLISHLQENFWKLENAIFSK